MRNDMKADEKKILIGKRSQLYRRLSKIRDILPGAFSIRQVLCGKSNCACKTEGKRHTVYQHSYKIDGKQVTKNIPKQYARQIEKKVLANKEFNRLMKQIQQINLKLLCTEFGKDK